MNTKKILLYIFYIFLCFSLFGRELKEVTINSILNFISCGEQISVERISRTTDSVCFQISFDLNDVKIKKCESVEFIPVWSFDTIEMILPIIRLHGRSAHKFFRRDSALLRNVDTTSRLDIYKYIHHWGENTREVDYMHIIPYESWMDSARINIVTRHYACDRENFTFGILHSPIQLEQLPPQVKVAETNIDAEIVNVESFVDIESIVNVTSSTEINLDIVNLADSLAVLNKFMHPMYNYASDKISGFQKFDDGSLSIKFQYKNTTVNTSYLDNGTNLSILCNTINNLLANKYIARIKLTLVGLSSPEGSFALNERLAQARIESLRTYFMKHSNINLIDIELYNIGENWIGLRRLVVASSISRKAQVLSIIDNVPIKKGREKQLMDLDRGNVYRYMLKHLFPSLRQAGDIRLYYETNMNKK